MARRRLTPATLLFAPEGGADVPHAERSAAGFAATAPIARVAAEAAGTAALDELARRVGFRVIPGLGERVIYRELFPKGLTLLDLAQLGEVGIAHIAARQELREMVSGLGIPGVEPEQKVAAAG